MPELPEVETVVRDLRPLVAGRTIRAVRHGTKKLREPWKPAWNELVAGSKVESIRRRGKWIVIDLVRKTDRPRLLVHLGMTGQFTAVQKNESEPDHLHVVFELDKNRELRFRDPRRFGCVERKTWRCIRLACSSGQSMNSIVDLRTPPSAHPCRATMTRSTLRQ